MTSVILKGWKPGLRKVALTKLLRTEAHLGLADAKRCTDRLLQGEEVDVPIRSEDGADRLAQKASALGVVVEIRAFY